MRYGGGQRPFNERRGVQICDKQQKVFPKWSAFAKLWSMKNLFAILPTSFEKSLIFQLFPRVMSLTSESASAVSTIMVVCLVLEAIMKNQFEKLNKISVAATAVGINEKAGKNRKVQDCA